MGNGIWPDKTLNECVKLTEKIPGDYAEIGVYRARLFQRLARAARERGRHAHAFDSFYGLGGKGEHDGQGFENGALSVGGPDAFRAILDEAQVPRDCYTLHHGYVPDCFKSYSGDGFALAFLDLDLYAPTVHALEWLWPRIRPGGILALDDVFPGRGTFAGRAVDEFQANTTGWKDVGFENSQLLLQKTKARQS